MYLVLCSVQRKTYVLHSSATTQRANRKSHINSNTWERSISLRRVRSCSTYYLFLSGVHRREDVCMRYVPRKAWMSGDNLLCFFFGTTATIITPDRRSPDRRPPTAIILCWRPEVNRSDIKLIVSTSSWWVFDSISMYCARTMPSFPLNCFYFSKEHYTKLSFGSMSLVSVLLVASKLPS